MEAISLHHLLPEQSLRYNMQFFLDSPARCNWNVKGYFNVQDGMHRIQYLYSKGYQEAPIVTNNGQYPHPFLADNETAQYTAYVRLFQHQHTQVILV